MTLRNTTRFYEPDAESTTKPENRIQFKTLIIQNESHGAHRERWRDGAVSVSPTSGGSQQKPDCGEMFAGRVPNLITFQSTKEERMYSQCQVPLEDLITQMR
jgi:hypothetical protein